MYKKITIFVLLVFLTLVLTDPATATYGMRNGIDICIKNLIPSLFPLFFLVRYLTEYIHGIRFNTLTQKIFRLCNISKGTEHVFLISLISGYPIGATIIYNLSKKAVISDSEAKRMMGFCNNAGPAFIFGIGICLFERKWIVWILWGIQILSSLLVAKLLPNANSAIQAKFDTKTTKTLSNIMLGTIKSMCAVCGWVLIFRVLTEFLERYIGKLTSSYWLICIKAFLELSNGCFSLYTIDNVGLRFVLFSIFLSFGGLSVWLQIKSAAADMVGLDFVYGKLLHIIFCALLSLTVQPIIFHGNISNTFLIGGILFCLFGICILIYIIKSRKIRVEKRPQLMYNKKKSRKEA